MECMYHVYEAPSPIVTFFPFPSGNIRQDFFDIKKQNKTSISSWNYKGNCNKGWGGGTLFFHWLSPCFLPRLFPLLTM